MGKISNINTSQQNSLINDSSSIRSRIEEKLLENKKKKIRYVEQIEMTLHQMIVAQQNAGAPSLTGEIKDKNHQNGFWMVAGSEKENSGSTTQNNQVQDKINSHDANNRSSYISNEISTLSKGIESDSSDDVSTLNKDIEPKVRSDLQPTVSLTNQITDEVQVVEELVKHHHVINENITDDPDNISEKFIYRFQQWGNNHSVIISEQIEGNITLKPSDELVEKRLTDALRDNSNVDKWQLDRSTQDKNHHRQKQNNEEDNS
uniref:SpaN/EivJ family type III secretion system needle length determinant n=1 Tax=Yersinia frederiksenii TaxID=29484 RepID=UPI001F4BD095|nr:type III secretion system needle length determinant, SpaN/EivJ family [Yersinia frederiksenii]ULG19768.1 hypothetical protein 49p1_00050 [Yersinia frederiksenii]